MISEGDKMIYNKELKFESDFKKIQKIVILNEEGIREVRNYREFLEGFYIKENISIEELESIFISFIRCIAIMKGVSIKVFDKSDNETMEKDTKDTKKIYLDNLESMIKIIDELDIARVLVAYG